MKTAAIMTALAMTTALATESLAAECQAATPEPVIVGRFFERCVEAIKGTEATKETEGTKRTKGTEGMKGAEGTGRKGTVVNGGFGAVPLLNPLGTLSSLVSLEGGANG